MKRTLGILLKLMMVTTIVVTLFGCSSKQPLRVLVLHQYDDRQATYERFDQTILRELSDAGYNPHVCNWYLNLEDQANMDCHQSLVDLSDSLSQRNWIPDVILAEGDRTFYQMHLKANDRIPSWRDSVISVYGGIRFHNLPAGNRFKKTIVIHDQLNMPRNLEIISKLTASHIVEIELDNYYEDSLIYLQINQQSGRQPYSMRVDSAGHLSGYQKPVIQCNDTLSLYFYSAEWDDADTKVQEAAGDTTLADMPQKTGFKNRQAMLDHVYQNAWRYPVLVPKKDVWSEAIARKTNRPQFTTCRELFDDGNGTYLCGYFTSYETMARDMVKAALDAYEGRGFAKNRIHEPKAYMDYIAMEQLGLKYSDYKDTFSISNVPMKVSNPLLYSIITIGNFIWILVLIFVIIFIWLKSHKDSLRNLSSALDEEREMNMLAIDASGNFYISNTKGIQRILDSMGPDQDLCKAEIKASLNEMGTHSHNYRIRAAMDEDKNMAWWSLRYVIDYNLQTGFDIKGYLLNVNEDVKFANEMQQIKKIANETKRTEGFLWTMAHEIRTPLNSIVGFCDVMKMMDNQMSEQEREQMVQGIQDNNLLLKDIVKNMDDFSGAVAHEIEYQKVDVHVDQLLQELYDENHDRFTRKGLKFVLLKGRLDTIVVGDYQRLKIALYQLIDNALKFTANGTVAIGWQYDLGSGMVELFVEDSGLGIPEEDLSLIFDMFWKRDTFMPGVGVGLSLAKIYVEAMGGEIKVKSELGIGSRMAVLMKGKDIV